MKNPREDQVFGYDVLAFEECPVIVIKCNTCVGVPVTLSQCVRHYVISFKFKYQTKCKN